MTSLFILSHVPSFVLSLYQTNWKPENSMRAGALNSNLCLALALLKCSICCWHQGQLRLFWQWQKRGGGAHRTDLSLGKQHIVYLWQMSSYVAGQTRLDMLTYDLIFHSYVKNSACFREFTLPAKKISTPKLCLQLETALRESYQGGFWPLWSPALSASYICSD